MSDKPKAAILGLGLMGAGMASHLLSQGFEVAVYNRNPAKAEALAGAGARICATPGEAAQGADVVIAMLADDAASEAVWLGGNGAMASLGSHAVAVESSTLSLRWVRELAAAAADHGVAFIDAPVTGSKAQAGSGQLKYIVGGETEAIERAAPVLEALSVEIRRVGPAGSGALMKLINNFMCGVQVATLAEALTAAERGGLDLAEAAGVLANGAPGSPLVKMVGQRMLASDYTPNFLPLLMAKDLAYAIEAASESGIELKTAAAARERFIAAADAGFAEFDIASVIEGVRAGK